MKLEREDKEYRKQLAFYLQIILNVSLIILAIALCILMSKEIYYFIVYALFLGDGKSNYELLERILNFFLYFEFIAMIVKYFQEHYHFPLRYFIYIGITAMVRLIIVDHDSATNTLLFTCAILVLVISYFIVSVASAKKDKL